MDLLGDWLIDWLSFLKNYRILPNFRILLLFSGELVWCNGGKAETLVIYTAFKKITEKWTNSYNMQKTKLKNIKLIQIEKYFEKIP